MTLKTLPIYVDIQVTAKIKETLFIESRCFHTGVFPDLTKQFNHPMLQSHDLNQIKNLWEILERHLRQHFPPPSTKHPIMQFLMEECCLLPPLEFQTLVESMPWHIEAVLAARGGPTPY